MYEIVLQDLQKRFPGTFLLTPEQVAEVIRTDVKTQANMRSKGTFPIPVKKVGAKVYVSIYDLAAFIANDNQLYIVKNTPLPKSTKAPPATKSKLAKKTKDNEWWTFCSQVIAIIDSTSLPLFQEKYTMSIIDHYIMEMKKQHTISISSSNRKEIEESFLAYLYWIDFIPRLAPSSLLKNFQNDFNHVHVDSYIENQLKKLQLTNHEAFNNFIESHKIISGHNLEYMTSSETKINIAINECLAKFEKSELDELVSSSKTTTKKKL